MGITHSSSVTNATSVLSSMMFNTVVSIKQTCQSNAAGVQNQAITVGTDDAVLTACLAKWSPADCAIVMSTGLSVFNVNQNAKVVQITQCSMDSTIISQLQASLTDQINQQLAKTTDGVTDDVKSLIQSTQNTNDNTVNTTDVKNFVTQNFTLDAVQEAINTVSTTQAQAITLQNAKASTIHDIGQAVQVEATLTLLQKNKATAAAIVKMDNAVTQSVTQNVKGVADIVGSITDMFKSLFNVLGAWIYAVYAVIALCILCCCACIIMTAMKGGGGGASANGGGGGTAVSQFIPSSNQADTLLKLLRR